MEETKIVSRSKTDLFFWILISILIIVGIIANYYFRELAWSLRFASWIILSCVLFGLAAFTTQGKRIWVFAKETRMELRKVVWPTKDETMKTTAVVAALVFIMAIILWALDSILLWIVGWFTK